MRIKEWMAVLLLVLGICVNIVYVGFIFYRTGLAQVTQTAIQTDIVSIRGCDIIQLVQDDKLITAFPAPDQPKSCKVQNQPERKKK